MPWTHADPLFHDLQHPYRTFGKDLKQESGQTLIRSSWKLLIQLCVSTTSCRYNNKTISLDIMDGRTIVGIYFTNGNLQKWAMRPRYETRMRVRESLEVRKI